MNVPMWLLAIGRSEMATAIPKNEFLNLCACGIRIPILVRLVFTETCYAWWIIGEHC
jgi:hypothetical protein